MKRVFTYCFLLLAGGWLFCHEAFTQTLTENYVSTYTPLKPVQTETQLNALTYHFLPTDITYTDGFGRPIQNIQVKGSSNIKDIIQPVLYDAFGRQTKQYLPYVNTVADGTYHSNSIAEQSGFYNSPPLNVTGTSLPFAETQFEASPLNRITLQGAQGSDWAIGGGHETEAHYLLNAANEIPIIALNASGDLILQGSYAQNTLFKNITINEQEQQTDVYTDLLGRTICTVAHNNVSDLLFTYNVYDDMGRLRVVLSPKAYQLFMAAGYATNETKELYFVYEYDERDRMISKKIPGKQIEYMVYDNWDRVIFTQDGNRRLAEEWYYIKYDSLSRPIETGLYKHPGGCPTAAALQQQVNSLQMPVSTGAVLYDDIIDQTNHNYQYTNYHATDRIIMEPPGGVGRFIVDANNNYTFIAQIIDFPEPQYCGPLTYSYYDDYDINDDNTPDYTFNTAVNSASGVLSPGVSLTPTNYVNGLPTVFKARVLGTGIYLATVTFYDKKGRAIQTQEDNYIGGKQIISTEYSFSGKPKVVYTQHTSAGTTTPTVTLVEKFTYDHRERLKAHTHKINNDAVHTIMGNTYNVIGQLQSKKHDASWQNTNYTYHIRGWLKKINDKDLAVETTDLFGMELYYEDGASPLYNGNISATSTQAKDGSGTLQGLNTYQYTYDEINRLLNAQHTGLHNASEGPISYDDNGNILTLKRNGFTDVGVPGQIDNLTYHYYGNQLLAVDDPAITTGYSEDYTDLIPYTTSADYLYDANGNLVLDKNAVKVVYNIHNLPDTVYFIGTGIALIPGKYIAFTYDAAGNKLRKRFVDPTTGVDKTYYYASQFFYTKNSVSDPIELTEITHAEGIAQRKVSNVYTYYYHLTDHLGNVRVVYTKEGSNYVTLSIRDYYPFGMEHRTGLPPDASDVSYKWGFNGMEKDNEIFGAGNSYTADFWQYDSRLGRRWNVDPVVENNISPYATFGNNPIYYADPLGNFKTRWGARWYYLLHQKEHDNKRGTVHKDALTGEWYVDYGSSTESFRDGSGTYIVTVYADRIFDKNGRDFGLLKPAKSTKATNRNWWQRIVDWFKKDKGIPTYGDNNKSEGPHPENVKSDTEDENSDYISPKDQKAKRIGSDPFVDIKPEVSKKDATSVFKDQETDSMDITYTKGERFGDQEFRYTEKVRINKSDSNLYNTRAGYGVENTNSGKKKTD
jgi:RHS repeat-associated protein